MKFFIIFIIRLYQMFLSPVIHAVFGPQVCRYKETCSQYAIRVIREKGITKGIPQAIRRLLSCQPFAKIQNT